MKTVVITGCAGFIGSHVTEKCLKEGYRVYGIDKYTYAGDREIIASLSSKYRTEFKFLQEDICDLKYLPDCDYVINIAAESHVGNSIVDSADFIKSNVLGVKNLLDLIRLKPSNVQERPVFFHFSTDEVYGDIAESEHLENDLLNPSNPYSASKAAADMLITAWSRTYGLKYLILRPTNNYGIRQYPEKLIPLCVKLLQRNKTIRLHDEGQPIRNWLHVEDTAEAVMTIIESGVNNEIFNISGSFEQSNWLTVKKIIQSYYNDEEIDWESFIDITHTRPGQDVRYALNDDKLRNLGWKSCKIFDEEIYNIVQFFKKQFIW
jgi:dTDP-glucose 4,6-dehydratase